MLHSTIRPLIGLLLRPTPPEQRKSVRNPKLIQMERLVATQYATNVDCLVTDLTQGLFNLPMATITHNSVLDEDNIVSRVDSWRFSSDFGHIVLTHNDNGSEQTVSLTVLGSEAVITKAQAQSLTWYARSRIRAFSTPGHKVK